MGGQQRVQELSRKHDERIRIGASGKKTRGEAAAVADKDTQILGKNANNRKGRGPTTGGRGD
jgi:hypothetical protein